MPPNLDVFSTLHLWLYFFHIWWVIEPPRPPSPLLLLIIVSIWNNIYSALIWKCSPIHTTLLKISLKQRLVLFTHLLAHSRPNTHFTITKMLSHMHACKYCTFMHIHYKKKPHIHIYTVLRPFISLFISIISHNYNSVLSGSTELESKCLLLAQSYISHSRRGGVRNEGFMNNASCLWRNKDKINPLRTNTKPFFWLISHL